MCHTSGARLGPAELHRSVPHPAAGAVALPEGGTSAPPVRFLPEGGDADEAEGPGAVTMASASSAGITHPGTHPFTNTSAMLAMSSAVRLGTWSFPKRW